MQPWSSLNTPSNMQPSKLSNTHPSQNETIQNVKNIMIYFSISPQVFFGWTDKLYIGGNMQKQIKQIKNILNQVGVNEVNGSSVNEFLEFEMINWTEPKQFEALLQIRKLGLKVNCSEGNTWTVWLS